LIRAVDTSVAVKWFVAEEDQDKAERLIGQPLVAPELLLAETANVAWKKWRKKEIGLDQAIAGQQMVTRSMIAFSSPFANHKASPW
jgi:predicted nucleic acid-binding protein